MRKYALKGRITIRTLKKKNAAPDFFKHNTDIGQNFLRDTSVVDWMMQRAALGKDDRVLEIGPGKGALTRGILGTPCGHLDAIELDTRLKDALEALAAGDERFSLHWGDAVTFDYEKLASPPTHVIANLPYHITTPLIWRLLETFSGHGLRYLLLMVQREAAERIGSGAGARESNPLGITLAALGTATLARRVSRGSFAPVPRVDSAVVKIVLSGENADLPRSKTWRKLLAGSFAQRRKTLINNWGSAFHMPRTTASEILAAHALPPLSRPEELPLDKWLELRRDEAMIEAAA